MPWYTDTAQVASAAFSGAAALAAYLAVRQARDAADEARLAAEETNLPALTVQVEHHVPSQLVSLLVANAGRGLAKGVFVLMTTDDHYAGSLVSSVFRPDQVQRVLTKIPSPGSMEDVPGARIVVVGRDIRERIWGWNHLGERKLLSQPTQGADTSDYTVEGIDALRAFWPDASFERRSRADALPWNK